LVHRHLSPTRRHLRTGSERVMAPTSPYAVPQSVEKIGPAAGHTPFRASWTANLARSGQTQTWRASDASQQLRMPTSVHNRPSWDGRHPVWERRIPQWSPEAAYLRSPAQRFGQVPPKRGFNPSLSETSSTVARSQLVTRDWSLLFSPQRSDSLIRRPWPEYEPESSAAVGRRWVGSNLGRLYEHVLPASSSSAALVQSPSPFDSRASL